MGTGGRDVVYLFDVDNTLLDNDAVQEDLARHLEREFGVASGERYWRIFEALRAELGYADYLGALQRYRLEHLDDPQMLRIALYLLDYPFADRLYAGSLAALKRCAREGTTAILSDGDVVFQPRKVQRSGLWQAVGGRVLIYVHKEQMLAQVAQRLPAEHYVVIDDKRCILASIKAQWGSRVTTVFVRQGHYAKEPAQLAAQPGPDVVIESIAALEPLQAPASPLSP